MTEAQICELIDRCKYPDRELHLDRDGERIFLQVRFAGRCAYTGELERQHGRKWLLSPHMTKSEVVTTAFKAIVTCEEHEIRERFRYRGKAIFGPHFDVDKLWEFCGQGLAAVDVRPEPQCDEKLAQSAVLRKNCLEGETS